MNRLVPVVFCVFVLGIAVETQTRAASVDDWDVTLTFQFPVTGGMAQDPLDLVLGVNPQSAQAEPKPPLPPGFARTGDPDDATISAYVIREGDHVYENVVQRSDDENPIYVWEINVDVEKATSVSLKVDLSRKPNIMAMTVFDPKGGTRSRLSGTGTVTINDLFELTEPGSMKLYFVATTLPTNQGGYVVEADGRMYGAVSLAGRIGEDAIHSGVQVYKNGAPISQCETDSSGAFNCDMSLSIGDRVTFVKDKYLRKTVQYDGGAIGVPTLFGGDLTGDNCVGNSDFQVLRRTWRKACDDPELSPDDQANCPDFTGDGQVGSTDFNVVKAAWRTCGDDF